MRRIAIATFVWSAISASAIADGYDPIFEPSPEARKATQATLVGLDQQDGVTMAAGLFGTVVKREDDEWKQIVTPTSVLLTSVEFLNDDVIWITGHEGVLLKSTDGGVTFERKLDGYQLLAMEQPWMEDRVTELEDEIERAADPDEALNLEYMLEELGFLSQGLEIQEEVGPTKPLLDIEFLNESVGFVAAAYGTLLKTTDGGESWQIISDRVENPMGFHLNKLIAKDEETLFLVGEYGLLFKSEDQGETWETLMSPYDGSYFGGLVDEQGRFWAFGLRGNVFVSNDGGNSFQSVETPTRYNLNSGTVLNNGDVVLVGHSGVIVHINHETLEASLYSHPSNVPIAGVAELSPGNLVLASRSGVQYFTIPNLAD
ncbi:MAG: Photosynthesis system II assembly factor YCF48 [Idiomarinaceae bacterium HL-53]|nr:MAG: Photosynthesis system II assembly factor YCF48 [Idiomarinaceae bacterium HL-53]CUS48911.1 Uncharacterized protein Ga0003345_1892 [Idiomarinaceae bacterium HL-53]